MNNRLKQRFRPARLLTVTAGLAAAAALVGCGSSAPNASNGSRTDATSSTLAFSNCMRANGVPDFPDLSNNGMTIEASGQTLSVNGVSVNAPAFITARQKCQKYLPHEHGTPAQAAEQRQRGLKFANCMRSHGVPNYPDPKIVSSHGGNQEVYLPGINPSAPAFQAAAKTCGGFNPKGS